MVVFCYCLYGVLIVSCKRTDIVHFHGTASVVSITADSLMSLSKAFIISNICNCKTIESNGTIKFYQMTDSLSMNPHNSDYDYYIEYEKFFKKYPLFDFNFREIPDKDFIDELFIDRNVYIAVSQLGRKYNEDISIDTFFEYILPYRIDNEELEDWRTTLSNKYSLLFSDEVLDTISSVQLCTLINNELKKHGILIHKFGKVGNGYKFSHLFNMKLGSCKDYCNLGAFLMRSLSVPCAIDGIPSGHTWNALLTKKGTVDFSTCEFNPGDNHLKKWLGYVQWKNVPKVYRQRFSPNPHSLAMIKGNEKVPLFFESPYYIDVTNEYAHCSTVKLTDSNANILSKRFGYLAVHNSTFNYVDWSVRDKDCFVFHNLVDSVVYFPTYYYTNKEIAPFAYPFMIVNHNGKRDVRDFCPSKTKRISVTLFRKYCEKHAHNIFLKRAIGGKFQAANLPDFSDAVDLYEIVSLPKMTPNNIEITESKKFKYFRYVAPDSSYCSMAELAFFDKNGNPIIGEIIGTDGFYENKFDCTKEKVFDGNLLSYYDAAVPNGAWVGMAVEDSTTIGRICYLMRNDDNHVQSGQEYELFYMDLNGWVSVGSKLADSDSISFSNVPENCILLLKNKSKGIEERIFTYENGKQVWW